MDVTFFEDVPYFSPEGKALLHHHSPQGENGNTVEENIPFPCISDEVLHKEEYKSDPIEGRSSCHSRY